jgi:F-type H+-transporting ATPase subunit b
MTEHLSFFIQVPLFLALWAVLTRFWFRPAMHVVRERAKRSEGALAEARKVQAETERLRVEHAAALDQARAEAHHEMQEMLRQAETEQRRLIDGATEDAQRSLAEARTQIAEQVATARRSLRSEVQVIAREVARTIIGRTV